MITNLCLVLLALSIIALSYQIYKLQERVTEQYHRLNHQSQRLAQLYVEFKAHIKRQIIERAS